MASFMRAAARATSWPWGGTPSSYLHHGAAYRGVSSQPGISPRPPQSGPRHSDTVPAYRSWLYVPGDSERKLRKSTSCGADLCILDLEDGVGASMKASARLTVGSVVPELTYPTNTDFAIRLNASGALSAEGKAELSEDIAMLSGLRQLPRAVVLSKVDSVQDVQDCLAKLDEALPRFNLPLGVYLMVETPLSMISLEDICMSLISHASCTGGGGKERFIPGGVIFGHMDYCTEAGVTCSATDRSKLLYVEQKMVTVAKAFRLQAVDLAFAAIKDMDGLKEDCRHASHTGFTGKTAIHPGHVQSINAAFLPPPDQVAWARSLLESYAQHQVKDQAQGVFVHDGQMVDEPIFRRARLILAATERQSKT